MDFNNIHYFAVPDGWLLLDVNSGTVYRIDETTVGVLKKLEKAGDFAAVTGLDAEEAAVLQELRELTDSGLLFSADAYAGKYEPPAPVLKSMCLNICHDCDLRCRYCFASTGDYGGGRSKMPFEVGAKALDYLLSHSGQRHFVEVDFFGGEPLMNIEVVKRLVEYGYRRQQDFGKQIRFTFTTNCVSLDDEISRWAIDNNIAVVLSHDGRPEIHDAMRVYPDGSGSHAVVTRNLSRFLELDPRGTAIVRGTYTAKNKDFVNDIQHWLDQGWRRLSMEPAVELSGDRQLTEADLPQLKAEYWRLVDLYRQYQAQGDPFNFFHFNLDIEHGPCLPKRLTGCGAGYEYVVVTPEGELYPCHQFAGRVNYRLGDLDSGIVRPEVSELFRQAHVYNKEKCSKCWARFYCSGGCHANADLFHQDIYEPYEMGCELAKIRTECALWLALQRQEFLSASAECGQCGDCGQV